MIDEAELRLQDSLVDLRPCRVICRHFPPRNDYPRISRRCSLSSPRGISVAQILLLAACINANKMTMACPQGPGLFCTVLHRTSTQPAAGCCRRICGADCCIDEPGRYQLTSASEPDLPSPAPLLPGGSCCEWVKRSSCGLTLFCLCTFTSASICVMRLFDLAHQASVIAVKSELPLVVQSRSYHSEGAVIPIGQPDDD